MRRVAGRITGALVLVAVGCSMNASSTRGAEPVASPAHATSLVSEPVSLVKLALPRSPSGPVPMPWVLPASPGPVPMPLAAPTSPGPVPMPQLLQPGQTQLVTPNKVLIHLVQRSKAALKPGPSESKRH